MKHPIPVSGTRFSKPNLAMPIPLYWRHDMGINWMEGEPVTLSQLESAIAASSGERLPNDLLPSLAPGDVIWLLEGHFWINPDWRIKPQ